MAEHLPALTKQGRDDVAVAEDLLHHRRRHRFIQPGDPAHTPTRHDVVDVSAELMAEAGLVVTGDDIAVPYDRFRDRVIFPIEDTRGRVVAFGGRAMSADVPAKYLNSPDTPLFSKGHLLYNLHRARGPAHEHGTLVVVEGYVDVIALAKVGFGHAVAPLGTALTEHQLALLWRTADEPILCFDGDKAGRRAAYRAVEVALPLLPPGKSLRFALLPENQDPDDLARAGGRDAVERVLGRAQPLVETLWARELEAGPIDTPERRAALAHRLREAIQGIRDETLRRFYRAEIDNRLYALGRQPSRRADGPSRQGYRAGPDYRAGRSRFGAADRFGQPDTALRASQALVRSAMFSGAETASAREALILGALFAHPRLLHAHAETLASVEIGESEMRMLAHLLLDCALHEDVVDPAILESRITRAGKGEALARMRARVVAGDRWVLDETADPLRLEDALKQAFTLQRRARTLNTELHAAERALAEDGSDANLVWLREVQAELTSADGAEAETGSN